MAANDGESWNLRNRDLVGRESEPWVRRIALLVLLALVVAALFNVFGQRPDTTLATSPAASLKVESPSRARGGDVFQARFDVHAFRQISRPLLILDPGWLQGLTQNTAEPTPVSERSDNGRPVLEYDTIPAGRKLTVWLAYQVNPTHVGTTDQDVELWDGPEKLLVINHSLTVFP